MTQIVTALFDTYDNASEAVRRLETAGVSYRDISIVSNAKDARHLVQHVNKGRPTLRHDAHCSVEHSAASDFDEPGIAQHYIRQNRFVDW